MNSLPIVDPTPESQSGDARTQRRRGHRSSTLAGVVMHSMRVAVFVSIILAIHWQHQWFTAQRQGDAGQRLQISQVVDVFPGAAELGEFDPLYGGQTVLDAQGKRLGIALQTSPQADKIIGFSGPTNVLVGLGNEGRIQGISVLGSGDTKEHLGDVLRNEAFMSAWDDRDVQQAAEAQVDGVSGATLTSMAIRESIALRLGGKAPQSRFEQALAVAEVKRFFADAAELRPDESKPSLLQVIDADGNPLGAVFRTSPHADHMIGYQGPADTLVAIDPQQRVVGVALRSSFDNQPYVGYVEEDEYFFNLFRGFTLADLAALDVVDAGIEGVSGATRTSVTVAESLVHTAAEIQRERPLVQPPAGWLAGSHLARRWLPQGVVEKLASLPQFSLRQWGTSVVVLSGVIIALTHLRGSRRLRIGLQVVVVAYLGFVNADMVSQALLVGWAQNGPPIRMAPALFLLTVAALVCPVFTGRNVYCTHLCPFGCLQDWLRRVPWKVKMRVRAASTLQRIPALLQLLVVLVAMLHWPLSLVGMEPFDAFVFRIAGWATITVAIVGLIAASLTPMAYCRFGCPTGRLLGYLRRHSASARLTLADAWTLALAAVAWAIYFAR